MSGRRCKALKAAFLKAAKREVFARGGLERRNGRFLAGTYEVSEWRALKRLKPAALTTRLLETRGIPGGFLR